MLGVVAAREVPVCAQLATGGEVEDGGQVGERLDGKVGMAEDVGPFVVDVGDNNWWYLRGRDEVGRNCGVGPTDGRDRGFS